jgi:CO/xanthine dehydrogenase FAD-binding subunit
MVLATYRLANGLIEEPRIAVGGAEPYARRLAKAEDILRGQAPGADAFSKAAEVVSAAIDPMEDINNTATYRRTLVRTLTQRALECAE